MQQVDIHLKKNEFNYAELKGENGTANYPACFLYLYTLFYFITYEGQNIFLAQIIKTFLYALYQYFTHRIYKLLFPKKLIPYFSLALFLQLTNLGCSVISLFNDIFISLPMAVSILRFMEQKTMQGIIWFVIASTFKIGAVFYLPATLLVITLMSGLSNVIVFVIILIGTQVAISLPFTTVNKQAYIEQNFNFSTIYPPTNTNSWNFLHDDFYYSDIRILTQKYLLVFSLIYFLLFKWTRPGRFFQDVRLLPFFKGGYRYQSPRKQMMIFGTCSLLFQFWSACLHIQFIQWTEMLVPALIYFAYGGEKGDLRWMIGVYYMREFCWAQPLLQQTRIFLDSTMSQMGFLGNSCLLYMIWTMPNIAQMFNEEGSASANDDSSSDEKQITRANGPSN